MDKLTECKDGTNSLISMSKIKQIRQEVRLTTDTGTIQLPLPVLVTVETVQQNRREERVSFLPAYSWATKYSCELHNGEIASAAQKRQCSHERD